MTIFHLNDVELSNCMYTYEAIYPISSEIFMKLNKLYSFNQWINWINRNICNKNLDKDSFYTTSVKLRIATGMLNKIHDLTKDEKIQLHNNLVENINNAIFYRMEKDLPF